MMIFSLVVMIGLEKCCITSAYLQWLCHSGERVVAHGSLVLFIFFFRENKIWHLMEIICIADDSHEMSNLIFSEK